MYALLFNVCDNLVQEQRRNDCGLRLIFEFKQINEASHSEDVAQVGVHAFDINVAA